MAEEALSNEQQQALAIARARRRRAEQSSQPQVRGPLLSAAMGANTRLASILGAPVDLATAALGYAGHKLGLLDQPLDLEQSFGGSASIRRGLQNLGASSYGNIEELAVKDRPFAVGGETFVGAAAPGFAAARVAQGAKTVLDPVTRMAQQAPGKFLGTEIGMATGSATGAAAAEQIAPGNPFARAAGEIVGGVVNPTTIGSALYNVGRDNVSRIAASVSPAGAERRAATIASNLFEKTGENKEALIQALRAPDQFNLGLTAGQMTASPTLLAMQSRLAKQSPQFAAEVDQNIPRAFNVLQTAAQDVARTGDPSKLTSAAQQRVGRVQGLAQTRAALEQQRAADARNAIGTVQRSEMQDASVQGREALEQALSNARAQERSLWEQIPRDVVTEPASVLSARERIRGELLPNESMPQPVETFTGNLARQTQDVNTGLLDAAGNPIVRPGQAEVTSGDLLRLRNRALTEARGAGGRSDFQLQRQMNLIAEGALDDLTGIPNLNATPARDFSRQLNENFTRGFGGDALSTDRLGDQRIPAEAMFERAFGTGGVMGNVRMTQLQDAARFGGMADEMLSAQDRFLRGAVQSAIDQQTGRVNPAKLAEFRNRNAALLNQFPTLKGQLGNAENAERELLRISAITEKAVENAGKTMFARVAGAENPATVVAQALGGQNPIGDYASLIQSARRAGPEAVAGLRASTLESVFTSATRQDGTIDFARLQQLLKRPASLQQGAPSLMQVMQSGGVLDKASLERLEVILDRANTVMRAKSTKSDFDKLMDEPDMLSNFIQRVVGANIGGALGQGTGAPLVAAGAGSKLVQNLFDKMPSTKVTQVLIEASKSPTLMAKLLEQTPVTKKREALRQLNGFLVNAGIDLIGEQEERRPLQQSLQAVQQ